MVVKRISDINSKFPVFFTFLTIIGISAYVYGAVIQRIGSISLFDTALLYRHFSSVGNADNLSVIGKLGIFLAPLVFVLFSSSPFVSSSFFTFFLFFSSFTSGEEERRRLRRRRSPSPPPSPSPPLVRVLLKLIFLSRLCFVTLFWLDDFLSLLDFLFFFFFLVIFSLKSQINCQSHHHHGGSCSYYN